MRVEVEYIRDHLELDRYDGMIDYFDIDETDIVDFDDVIDIIESELYEFHGGTVLEYQYDFKIANDEEICEQYLNETIY